MGKNRIQKSVQKPSQNKNNKKASEIFKVASSSTSSKKKQKKTKEIPKKLKQLDLKDKADAQLKNIHLQMVSKKDVKQAQSIAKKKLPAPNTDNVQTGINKMNVE